MDVVAPISAPILQIVALPVHDIFSAPSPKYSTTDPVPPFTVKIPANFDYKKVKGLSNELVQKLSSIKPESIAQANRIPGMTPAAVSLLIIYLKAEKAQL